MPRSIPKSTTRASSVGSPLGESEKGELIELLMRRGFPRAEARKFVSCVNSAIVGAYELNPVMSTNGQRRQWFSKVRQAIVKTRDILACADDNQDQGLQFWRSEDLQALDSALLQYLDRKKFSSYESPLVQVLEQLANLCETKMEELPTGRKPSGPRQHLADDLANFWQQELKRNPTATIAARQDGKIASSPFVEMLQFTIGVVENRAPRVDVLRGLAERAIDSIKRRDEIASRFLQH